MQSLLTQLEAATVPLESNRYTTAARKTTWARAVEKAHLMNTANAVERYKKAMEGEGWLPQWQIEAKLGYGRTVANDFLKKLVVELQLVEKRNKNGTIVFNRRLGYEYKWKEVS